MIGALLLVGVAAQYETVLLQAGGYKEELENTFAPGGAHSVFLKNDKESAKTPFSHTGIEGLTKEARIAAVEGQTYADSKKALTDMAANTGISKVDAAAPDPTGKHLYTGITSVDNSVIGDYKAEAEKVDLTLDEDTTGSREYDGEVGNNTNKTMQGPKEETWKWTWYNTSRTP